MSDPRQVIALIILGIVTYLLRSSFIVFWSKRELPNWLRRHLRYTAVTILPAMIAPLIIFPRALGGETNAIWIISAISALIVGIFWRKPLPIMLSGALVFICLSAILS